MTTLTNLSKQGQASLGVTFDAVDKFTFDISEMNAVITAYNAANATNHSTWNTVTDNYEKLFHFILIFSKVQNLILGNDTLNFKWTGTTPQNQLFGARGSLNSRILSFAFPFSSQSDIDGDSDNIG